MIEIDGTNDVRDEPRGTVHPVRYPEYCELLVSRRKLEAVPRRPNALRDVASGELYVLVNAGGDGEDA